ncbi:MAG: flagellar hook-associated protein 3 [Spirochaetales bacterium]|nr:flagellar hook-associated protein 3 [Spirochaetales bacterium]
MKRISTYMPSNDMQYHLRLREWKMSQLNNKMASQTKIQNLRDDPLAASRSIRYQSMIMRMRQYADNVETVRGRNAQAEGYLNEAVDVLQRVRELAVQGSNGIYQKEELAYMGEEVDQLLHELVQIGNAHTGDGTTLFSGFNTQKEPFRVIMGRMETVERIISVDYVGNIGRNKTEISEGAFAEVNMPGNYVFWAENENIYSSIDATTYQVQADSYLEIDGVPIEVKAGDNIYAIINKINASAAPVKAELDPVKNSMFLKTTVPHQLWLRDGSSEAGGTGTVLQDLGIIKQEGNTPPENIAGSALSFGASIFDIVINLRDRLLEGDTEQIGGAGLGSIDNALHNLSTHRSELGAKDRRLELAYGRLDYETPVLTELNSNEIDLDLSEAITELKMLEYTHKAALNTTARIMQPSLLDYLR